MNCERRARRGALIRLTRCDEDQEKEDADVLHGRLAGSCSPTLLQTSSLGRQMFAKKVFEQVRALLGEDSGPDLGPMIQLRMPQ